MSRRPSRRTTLTRVLATCAATALLVAGCGGGSAEEPTSPATESSVGSPDSSGSPTPTDETSEPEPDPGIDTEDVTFAPLPDVPDGLDQALAAYVEFEQKLRVLLRTARVPDGFDEVAASTVQQQYGGTVQYLRRTDQRYEGTVVVTVDNVQGNRRVAVVEGCADATDLLVPNDEGEPRPGETTAFRATLNQSGGLWMVTEYGASDRTC